MRRVVDLIAVLTILTIAGAWWMTRDTGTQQERLAATALEVDRLRATVLLRSQSDRHMLNAHGWPMSIDPAWFGEDLPLNPLVDADRPWLEVAVSAQSGWEHPRPLFVLDQSTAMFWYNPALGIVRARVPLGTTDAETLASYNAANKASLHSVNPSEFGDLDSIDVTSFDINDIENDD